MSLTRKPAAPPTLEERHAGASALGAFARSTFSDVVADLEAANSDLDAVAADAQAEIDRLTALRDDAFLQRRANAQTVTKIADLIG